MQPPHIEIGALLLGGSLTSMGYGVLLPVMPGIVDGLHTAASPQTSAPHTDWAIVITVLRGILLRATSCRMISIYGRRHDDFWIANETGRLEFLCRQMKCRCNAQCLASLVHNVRPRRAIGKEKTCRVERSAAIAESEISGPQWPQIDPPEDSGHGLWPRMADNDAWEVAWKERC